MIRKIKFVLFSVLLFVSLSFGSEDINCPKDNPTSSVQLIVPMLSIESIISSCQCERPYLVPNGAEKPLKVVRDSIYTSMYLDTKYSEVKDFCKCQEKAGQLCIGFDGGDRISKEQFTELIFKSYAESYSKTFSIALDNFVNIISQYNFDSSSGFKLPISCSPKKFFDVKFESCGKDGVSDEVLKKRRDILTKTANPIGKSLVENTSFFLSDRIDKKAKYFPPEKRSGKDYENNCMPEMYYRQSRILRKYTKYHKQISDNISKICRSYNKFGRTVFEALGHNDKKAAQYIHLIGPRFYGDGAKGFVHRREDEGRPIPEEAKSEILNLYDDIKKFSMNISSHGYAGGGELYSASSMFEKIFEGDNNVSQSVSSMCTKFDGKEEQINGLEFASSIMPSKDLEKELSGFCDKFIGELPKKLLCQKDLMTLDSTSINNLYQYSKKNGIDWGSNHDQLWCKSLGPESRKITKITSIEDSQEISRYSNRFLAQDNSERNRNAISVERRKRKSFNKILCPVLLDCNDEKKSCRIKGINEVMSGDTSKLTKRQMHYLKAMQEEIVEFLTAKGEEMKCPAKDEFVCPDSPQKCCKVTDNSILVKIGKGLEKEIVIAGDISMNKGRITSHITRNNLLLNGEKESAPKSVFTPLAEAPTPRKAATTATTTPTKDPSDPVILKRTGKARFDNLDEKFNKIENYLSKRLSGSDSFNNNIQSNQGYGGSSSRGVAGSPVAKTKLDKLSRQQGRRSYFEGDSETSGTESPDRLLNENPKAGPQSNYRRRSNHVSASRSMSDLSRKIKKQSTTPVDYESDSSDLQEEVVAQNERPTSRKPASTSATNTVGVVGRKGTASGGGGVSIPSVSGGGSSGPTGNDSGQIKDKEELILEKTEQLVDGISLQKVEGDFLYLTVPSNLTDEKVPIKDRHPEYVLKMSLNRDTKSNSVVGVSFARGHGVRGLLRNIDISVLLQKIATLLQNR